MALLKSNIPKEPLFYRRNILDHAAFVKKANLLLDTDDTCHTATNYHLEQLAFIVRWVSEHKDWSTLDVVGLATPVATALTLNFLKLGCTTFEFREIFSYKSLRLNKFLDRMTVIIEESGPDFTWAFDKAEHSMRINERAYNIPGYLGSINYTRLYVVMPSPEEELLVITEEESAQHKDTMLSTPIEEFLDRAGNAPHFKLFVGANGYGGIGEWQLDFGKHDEKILYPETKHWKSLNEIRRGDREREDPDPQILGEFIDMPRLYKAEKPCEEFESELRGQEIETFFAADGKWVPFQGTHLLATDQHFDEHVKPRIESVFKTLTRVANVPRGEIESAIGGIRTIWGSITNVRLSVTNYAKFCHVVGAIMKLTHMESYIRCLTFNTLHLCDGFCRMSFLPPLADDLIVKNTYKGKHMPLIAYKRAVYFPGNVESLGRRRFIKLAEYVTLNSRSILKQEKQMLQQEKANLRKKKGADEAIRDLEKEVKEIDEILNIAQALALPRL